MSKREGMSLRLLSGHLPSQMFNWITPMTPPRGSSESQRRHINKHKKINICIWMDLTAKTLVDTWEVIQGLSKIFHVEPFDCTVILAIYGSYGSFFLACFSLSCADTHIRQQQTIKLWNNFCFGVKAGANIIMCGMFDITTETPSVSNHNKAICSA